jgi:Uma2 family endonuclease
MTIIDTPVALQPQADVIVLENASWELYELLVRERDAAGQHFKITYDQGRMSLVSPLPIHDLIKKFVGRMIEYLDAEQDIGISCYGSTTWRRKDLAKGLEPDECYYVETEPSFDPNRLVDLTVHAPPDLVLEVDITRNPIKRMGLYAALGVKEVWRYKDERVEINVLGADGRYTKVFQSPALPVMTEEVINRFATLLLTSGERKAIRAFREWVKALPPVTGP